MITSKTNPLIRQARQLRHARARKETGLFLIEGIRPVGAAMEAGWEIVALLYSDTVLPSAYGKALLSRAQGRVDEVDETVLQTITEKDHPQGIVAIARQHHAALSESAPTGVGVALVSPQDPGNLGSIVRTIDAVGGSALYLLDGGVDPFHPTAVRASMGASFFVPMVEASFSDFGVWCRAHGVLLIGTSAQAATSYLDIRIRQPCIVLLGSEQKGLGEEYQRLCNATVSLPMRGRSSSLNLAVAAGILLYAYADARAP